MSFLNALASDGLSVGLRFYNQKMNSQPVQRPSAVPGSALEKLCPARAEPVSAPKTAAAHKVENSEEMAAGRAEAQAKLTADGSLGQLAAAIGQIEEENGSEAGQYVGGVAAVEERAADNSRELSDEEKRQVEELKRRDREVRAHEQAHVAAAAGLAGAPVYEYQVGPDGKRYAVGGHVDVRTRGGSDPEVALREAEAVKRAATAPASPSGPDRAAAAQASARINQIKAEKMRESTDDDENDAYVEQQDLSTGQVDGGHPAELSGGVFNGVSFGRQVLGAYAAAKFSSAAMAIRPALAQV